MSSTPEDRARFIAQMNASFAHEGLTLDPLMANLQRRYIEGTITLADMQREIDAYWAQQLGRPVVRG